MLDIIFVSDYVCPYCLLAKEALKKALALSDMQANITWQPLELSRRPPKPVTAPPSEEERAARMRELQEACKALDLTDMKLPPSIPRPTTTRAFEGWRYACDQGLGEEWNDLMYRAFFIEELDISDMDVLCSLARRIGLNEEGLVRALEENVYSEVQTEAVRHSLEDLHAFYVPTLIVNGVQAEPEAYTISDMLNILLGHASEGGAMRCGADGCHEGV